MGKLRFAVIGTGFGTTVHIPAIQDCTEAEVVAVCSAQQQRAHATAKRFGIARWSTDYRQVVALPEVDAVAIATPAYLHHPMAMAAIEAGKHVLCEKPMGLNAAECREMLAAAQARGIVHMVCFEFRWTPARAYMAHLIREGQIGEIRHINIALHLPERGGSLASPYLNWAAQRKYGGGMLFALGSHYIDMVRWYAGELEGVFGQVYVHAPERKGPETGQAVMADADDAFSFLLRARSRAWASMTASMAAPFGTGSRIEVYGSEGALFHSYPSFNPSPRGKLYGGSGAIPIPEEYFPLDDDRDDRMMPFRLMVGEFVKAVRSGKPVAPTFHDGLKVQAVMDGVFQASDTGRWVEL